MSKQHTPRTVRTYRIRRFLDQRFVIAVVVLGIVALLGGALAYQAFTTPVTATEERVDTVWTEETALTHQADVVRPTSVFEADQTLSDRPVYFTRLSPSFAGIHEYTYGTDRSGDLRVESTATLRIRAVDGGGSVYWEYTEPLASETTSSLTPGQTVTMPVTLNVTTLDTTVAAIESDVGASVGTTEILVAYETRLTGTIGGEQVANAHTDTLRVVPDSGSYRLDAGDGVRLTHDETTAVTTEQPVTPLRSYGPIVIGLISTIGFFGLTTAKFRNRLGLTSDELHALELYEQRQTFDDWISSAHVPERALTGPEIRTDSLADLVDVAIDTNQRVLEDVSRSSFYVLAGNGHYVFTPVREIPELPSRTEETKQD